MSKLDRTPGDPDFEADPSQELKKMLEELGDVEAVQKASDQAAYREYSRTREGQELAEKWTLYDRLAREHFSELEALKDFVNLDSFFDEETPLPAAVKKLRARRNRLAEKRMNAPDKAAREKMYEAYSLAGRLAAGMENLLEQTPSANVADYMHSVQSRIDTFKTRADLAMSKLMQFNESEKDEE